MIQDPGPKHNLGFGIPIVHGESDPEAVETGVPVNSGAVAKALGDKPLLKFAAVATASLVSMHVAGKVARAGGYRLAYKAQDVAASGGLIGDKVKDSLVSVRKIQDILDEYEGVYRKRVDLTAEGRHIFVKRDSKGNWIKDNVQKIDGATFRNSMDDTDPWQLRDGIQQRLVRQARRLPYELPGFYVADKAINDPVLGNDQRREVNWSNPVDVIGDFAWESTKNVAFAVTPFEMAGASGAQAFRRLQKTMAAPAGIQATNTGVLTTKVMLEQLGVKSEELITRTIRSSKQTMGAFSQAVEDASKKQVTVAEVVRGLRHGMDASPGAKASSAAARRNLAKQMQQTSTRVQLADAMPGPFSGMGTAFQSFKKTRRQIGQTFDDLQDVRAGRVKLTDLDDGRKNSVIAMNYGRTGSPLEAVARQLEKMGLKTTATSAEVAGRSTDSELARVVKSDHYKDILRKNLVIAGMDDESAQAFVTHSSRIALPGVGNRNLISDFRLTKTARQTASEDSWFAGLVEDAGQHQIGMQGVTLKKFKRAVAVSDARYSIDARRPRQGSSVLDAKIEAYHRQIVDKIAPDLIGEQIASGPIDFLKLKSNLDFNENFLVRNAAKSMGIRGFDDKGEKLALKVLKDEITARGIDASDKQRLLGVLVDNKVVRSPNSGGGLASLFGFKKVGVDESLDSLAAAGYDQGTITQMRGLLRRRGTDPVLDATGKSIGGSGLGSLNMPGVYRTPNGNILDVGRIKRDIVGAVDSVLSETKVPVLNLNASHLTFYNSWMSARKAAPLQFASKYSKQLSTKGKAISDRDGLYTFMRTGKSSKGSLFKSQTDIFGSQAELTQVPGEFKPFLSNRLARTGQYSEIFLGTSSAPGSGAQEKSWRRLFDVSTDQESNMFFGSNSLFGRTFSALRKRSVANRNPRRAASVMSDKGFGFQQIDEHLSQGVDDIIRDLKGYGLNDRKITTALRSQGLIKSTDKYDDIIGFSRGSSVLPEASIPQAAREILEEDIKGSTFSENQKKALRGMQSSLRTLLRGGDEQSGFWDMAAPSSIKTPSVSRRMDQLKSELSEYMFLREGVSDTATGFSMRLGSLLKEIDNMHMRGTISSLEKAEARASALSLQLQFSKSQVLREAGESKEALARIPMNRQIMNHALQAGNDPGQTRQLLREYGEYRTEHQGLFGRALAGAKQRVAPAGYQSPPIIDAVGADYTFIPTVASGFKNNPGGTMRGLLGGSWRDPETVTSGSIYPAHLVNRINHYFETIGLGLDPGRYNSPLDLYGRGIIGKRVLPMFAAGTTAVAVDRTIGGMVKEDEQGNPVYSPLVIGGIARGVVEGQSVMAGLIPGGQSYNEKKEELLSGDVPIRQGRYWLLNSNTPFKGGRVQYFRPSWYQRLQAGGEYTPEMNQTPLEKLAFGYDFSPLRPLDPYRFERENATSRPYPVSGDYFTGPFGPMTSVLNSTVGNLLKPTMRMNRTETAAQLASYAPVGESASVSMGSVSQSLSGINASYAALAGAPGSSSVEPFYNAMGYSQPRGYGSQATIASANSVSSMYSSVAEGGAYPGLYMPMLGGLGMNTFGAQVVPSKAVGTNSQAVNRAGRIGYESQEMAGIYGFGFSSARSALGLGSVDYTPSSAVLESASRGYSSSRSFWNLNLGGAGDVPLPIEGRFASLEFSEIIRRFVPREQQGIQYINGIANDLGRANPWLPSSLRHGDPYNIPDATIRLPGTGRDRVRRRYGSTSGGQYSAIDVHDMLGDLDPFGDHYRQIDRMVDTYAVSAQDRAKIAQTRAQAEAVSIKSEFTPYKYKYMDPSEMVGEAAMHPFRFGTNKLFESIAHKDTFINSKFLRTRTAVEDWERDNVYGATYPEWSSPYNSFIEPIINRSTQRNPLAAASAGGAIGYLFGATARAKTMGGIIGASVTGAASAYGQITEAVTGNRFVPKDRKKQLALEEQADILSYTHAMVNASRALDMGDRGAAQQFLQASTRTMYGANLNATPEQLALAVPKRKREHFEAMMYAPEQERKQILSTAGRLERRMLQAAWGMNVEQLPDLNEYFQQHELPPPDSGFWSPYTDMEAVKIKMGQNMGIDMSQMGYYPQQIQEANLVNPAYPAIFSQTSSQNTRQRLNELLRNMGVRGSVEQRPSVFTNGDRFQLSIGTS